jgi:hypothetical protein
LITFHRCNQPPYQGCNQPKSLSGIETIGKAKKASELLQMTIGLKLEFWLIAEYHRVAINLNPYQGLKHLGIQLKT